MRKIIVALTLMGLIGGAAQANDEMEGRGRILNADGAWCWFMQTVDKTKVAFLGPLSAEVATISFEDLACMAETTKEGLDFAADFNRDQIAKRIAGLVRGNWVTPDTVYESNSRNQPGMMQTSGECMVAKDMPATAIAINFVSNGTSITKVEYAHVFGCGASL